MKISIHKTFTHNGTTCFAGSSPTVTEDVAIAAVIARATDDPAAIALAEASGAAASISKSIDKMSAKDARAELKRVLAGNPDAGLQQELDDAKASLAAKTTEADAAADSLEAFAGDVDSVLTAMGIPTEGEISERLAAAANRGAELTAQLELAGTGEAANEEAMTNLLAAYNAAAPEGDSVTDLSELTNIFLNSATA